MWIFDYSITVGLSEKTIFYALISWIYSVSAIDPSYFILENAELLSYVEVEIN